MLILESQLLCICKCFEFGKVKNFAVLAELTNQKFVCVTYFKMMVTTPEKWDVVTRKSTGDVALAQLVKLLIIDEVHLLHDDRGSVIESLVARTLRQVILCSIFHQNTLL